MTEYEKISLITQIVTSVSLIIGLIYGAIQLRKTREQLKYTSSQLDQMKKVHSDNHDWNRRKTSQELLNILSTGDFQEELNKLRIAVKEKLNVDMQDRSKNYMDLISSVPEEMKRDIN
jgi:uncharacterized membrane-anchored protein YhcB (DUF1043 family)